MFISGVSIRTRIPLVEFTLKHDFLSVVLYNVDNQTLLYRKQNDTQKPQKQQSVQQVPPAQQLFQCEICYEIVGNCKIVSL